MDELSDTVEKFKTKTHFTYSEIQSCINSIPALFWRIEVVNNKIEYLNSYEIVGLGKKTMLLLRNVALWKKIVLEEDHSLLDVFFKSVEKRQQSIAVFRIKLEDGTIKWLKISGAPDPENSYYYTGHLTDITDALEIVRIIEKEGAGLKEQITLFNNPIALINFADKKIYAVNSVFNTTFGINETESKDVSLDDLLGENPDQRINHIFEEIVFHRQWNGSLIFVDSNKKTFHAETAVRAITKEGKNLLWVSIYHATNIKDRYPDNPDAKQMDQATIESRLAKALKTFKLDKGINELLNIIRDNQPLAELADSILYSDIHIDQGKVITYGVGPSFESLEPGKEYPYEGTIAENIEKFKLDYIIVENTLKSIKPIDWALFIPRNVMSYYAKPFYDNDVLRTVLIFCSQKKAVFSKNNTRTFEPLFPLIQESLAISQKIIEQSSKDSV